MFQALDGGLTKPSEEHRNFTNRANELSRLDQLLTISHDGPVVSACIPKKLPASMGGHAEQLG